MTKNDFVKASRGEFSKTSQINYNTVLLGFDLLQMAHDCNECISTKKTLVHPLGEGDLYQIWFFFLASLFINFVISFFVNLFILSLSIFLIILFYFINHR